MNGPGTRVGPGTEPAAGAVARGTLPEPGGGEDPHAGAARGAPGRAKEMPFLEHLDELRRVFVDSLWVLLVACVAGWFVSAPLLEIMIRPAGALVFMGPAGALDLRMKISFFAGLLIASPFILWKLWSFVAPGLLPVERRVVGPLVVASSLLLIGGAAFADLVLAPIAIRFLLSFSTPSLQPLLTAEGYFDFLTKMCLAFGLFFQMPIVMGVLAWVGVLPRKLLVSRWREAIVIIAVIAAIFTPPDIVSMAIMGGPLLVLYALSTVIALVVARKRSAR